MLAIRSQWQESKTFNPSIFYAYIHFTFRIYTTPVLFVRDRLSLAVVFISISTPKLNIRRIFTTGSNCYTSRTTRVEGGSRIEVLFAHLSLPKLHRSYAPFTPSELSNVDLSALSAWPEFS